MDLLDEDSVRAAGEVVNAVGPLFGLVNNAGAALPGPLEIIPIEVFRRQIEINLTAQLLVTQVMLPALHRSADQVGDARIIMIGSISGRLSGPMLGGYGAAKHGLAGLSSSLRAELAPFKIKVLLIEPGAIGSAMQPFSPEERSAMMEEHKLLPPDEVADAIMFAATRKPGVDIVTLRIEPLHQKIF